MTHPNLRRRRLLAGSLGLALAPLQPAFAQVRVEGYTFPRDAVVGGRALRLNGVGLRAVAWLKGYAAGLYLAAPAASAAAVLADGGPKRLRIRLLHDVPAAEFVKAFDKGVRRNTAAAEVATLETRMRRFDERVAALGTVRKGDVVDLDWLPAEGLRFTHNTRLLGEAIPGADFYAALLRIFIGERPVDPELKAGLLGGPVA